MQLRGRGGEGRGGEKPSFPSGPLVRVFSPSYKERKDGRGRGGVPEREREWSEGGGGRRRRAKMTERNEEKKRGY